MCSSVDYWRCRWIKLGGALEYPQRGPSDPHLEPDLSTVCPQGYPQGWREDPQGVENGTRRCGDAHICPSTEARSPPRRANWAVRIQVPVREGGAGSSSSAAAHRGAPTAPLAPGRAVGSVAVGAQPGTAPALPGPRCPVEAVGVDPRRAGAAGTTPPPPPHPGVRPDRGARMVDIVGVPLRTRIGSELEGLPAQRGCAGGGCAGSAADSSAGPPGSTRARAVRWTPLHAGPSPHPSRSPRPSRRGRGRFGGGMTRPLKKVAGADLSPSAPRSSRPEVAQ